MVKCAECGYLAVRNRHSYELEEADEIFRRKGVVPLTGHAEGRARSRHEPLPLCFVQRHDLRNDYKEANEEDNSIYSGVHRVIIKERECELFTKWQQGFTPKEHREMMDRKEFREWQASREDSDRKWKSKQQWFMVLVAGIFTILGAVIVLLTN